MEKGLEIKEIVVIKSYIKIRCDECEWNETDTCYDRKDAEVNAEQLGWKKIDGKWYCTECQGGINNG